LPEPEQLEPEKEKEVREILPDAGSTGEEAAEELFDLGPQLAAQEESGSGGGAPDATAADIMASGMAGGGAEEGGISLDAALSALVTEATTLASTVANVGTSFTFAVAPSSSSPGLQQQQLPNLIPDQPKEALLAAISGQSEFFSATTTTAAAAAGTMQQQQQQYLPVLPTGTVLPTVTTTGLSEPLFKEEDKVFTLAGITQPQPVVSADQKPVLADQADMDGASALAALASAASLAQNTVKQEATNGVKNEYDEVRSFRLLRLFV
jgi:hypothetical protein